MTQQIIQFKTDQQQQKKELQPGDTYLTVQLFGKEGPRIACFKVNETMYKGEGVVVFVNKKKDKKQQSTGL